MAALYPTFRQGYASDGNGNIAVYREEIEPLQPDEVLLQVKAIGVNRADILQVKGFYNPPVGTTPILGLECSGVILACGANVHEFAVGDRVCALMAGGAYADFCTVHQALLLPMPDSLSFQAAAALPEALATSWLNLVTHGGINSDSTVVITAASGGIGTIAIQLAKYFSAHVLAVSSSPQKKPVLLSLGADVVLPADVQQKDVWKAALPNGFTIAMDMLGGEIVPMLCEFASIKARIMIVGLLMGNSTNLPLNQILMKNISVIGTTLRSLSLAEKSHIITNVKKVFPDLLSQHIRPIIHAEFSLSNHIDAFTRMRQSEYVGKIILYN